MDAWFNALLILCAVGIPFAIAALGLAVFLELRDWIRQGKRPAPRKKRRKVPARR
jgi:hypothetical protein